MPPKDKYTDPKLRDKIKEEIHNSDKGGAPGQWSARKAQFMASEYKKRGGTYNTDKEKGQDDSGKNLDKWTNEEWQTSSGSSNAKNADGTQERYLPKKAWEQMSEREKKDTDAKKQKESKEGKQFVGNTGKAKDARKKANEEEEEHYEGKKGAKGGKSNGSAKSKGGKKAKEQEVKEDDEEGVEEVEDDAAAEEDADEAYEDDGDVAEDDDESAGASEEEEEKPAPKSQTNGKKRGAPAKSKEEPESKKSKTSKSKGTVGSKHDPADPPAKQGSAKRLPKKGQHVQWKALPGWVGGKVTEIVTTKKKVNGKDVKASKDDPRIALEADSGKPCVHKPEAVYFD